MTNINNFLDNSFLVGIEIPREEVIKILKIFNISPLWELQKSLHITVEFFGFKTKEEKEEIYKKYSPFFGKPVTVTITGYGEYSPNGEVLNQGLFVTTEEITSCNKVPHITLAINKMARAKAVDTAKMGKVKDFIYHTKGQFVWYDKYTNTYI